MNTEQCIIKNLLDIVDKQAEEIEKLQDIIIEMEHDNHAVYTAISNLYNESIGR